jgi:alkanesulfonate monooxygenase SsuD/methylene tetrahydromethanopterin reductase-like flavin-dependent oxidoreductase (luciferase family)
MKAGVLQFFSWPERRIAIETVYERALQRIEIMDTTGYDCVWLAEHHFHTFSVCPSVHMMGLYAASRTRRMRIGTAVSLAEFYHPLQLAEEVALLDILSGGRVNWGAGRGFDPTEFRAFGVLVEESAARFQEMVLQAWRDDRLTYHGRYFDFENVEVLPKPMQKPHPPTWLAASSPQAIERAAARGFSILRSSEPARPPNFFGSIRRPLSASLSRRILVQRDRGGARASAEDRAHRSDTNPRRTPSSIRQALGFE